MTIFSFVIDFMTLIFRHPLIKKTSQVVEVIMIVNHMVNDMAHGMANDDLVSDVDNFHDTFYCHMYRKPHVLLGVHFS
jgi:hypothetical protein